jgi:putative tryptophan/tyrosine transport system substrate-binding protein
MQRILAIAVGTTPGKDRPEVLRGTIKGGRVEELRPYIGGLIAGLDKLGRKGGEDYEIDYATCDLASLKKLVKAYYDEQKPDAIFAMSTSALKCAMSVCKETPIIFPSISDPMEDGGAKSNATPGKNATGVRAMRRQTAPDGLELFKVTVPSLKTVYALQKPAYGPASRAMSNLKKAAKRARVTFKPVLVKSLKDIEKAISGLSQTGKDGKPEVGVFVLPDDVVLSASQKICTLAQERRIPTFFPATDWVRAKSPSALGGYGVPQRTCGEAAAPYMHKVLDGIPANDLPIKRVGGFEWAVNKAVAQAIGIKLPDSVMKAADRVVG